MPGEISLEDLLTINNSQPKKKAAPVKKRVPAKKKAAPVYEDEYEDDYEEEEYAPPVKRRAPVQKKQIDDEKYNSLLDMISKLNNNHKSIEKQLETYQDKLKKYKTRLPPKNKEESKPDSKPESKPEVKVETKVESTVEPKIESKPTRTVIKF